MTYFWYAARLVPSDMYPHSNEASGLVEADSAYEAMETVLSEARRELGNTKQFVVRQFNEVR